MADIRLWILKILDGLLTLLGEIIVFFGVYEFVSSRSLSLLGGGLFLMLLGQMAGINAVKYEDRKKLMFFSAEVLENLGRQFAYPVLIFAIYLMGKSELLLVLAFTFTLVALVKSAAIVYKSLIVERIIS